MRAIDGDALRDRLQNLGYDDWNQGATTTWAEAFNECADMVDEQPTIEPQRTGRWRHYEGYLTCSECGTEYDDDIMTHCCDDVPRFCPDCGARMEGEG